jgi:hypothetical protein
VISHSVGSLKKTADCVLDFKFNPLSVIFWNHNISGLKICPPVTAVLAIALITVNIFKMRLPLNNHFEIFEPHIWCWEFCTCSNLELRSIHLITVVYEFITVGRAPLESRFIDHSTNRRQCTVSWSCHHQEVH